MQAAHVLKLAPALRQQPEELQDLIYHHLLQSCCVDAARAFKRETRQQVVDQIDEHGRVLFASHEQQERADEQDDELLIDADRRKSIRDALLSGFITQAIQQTHTHYPSLLQSPRPYGAHEHVPTRLATAEDIPALFDSPSLLPLEYTSMPSAHAQADKFTSANADVVSPFGIARPLNEKAIVLNSRRSVPRNLLLDLEIQDFIENIRQANANPSTSSNGINGHTVTAAAATSMTAAIPDEDEEMDEDQDELDSGASSPLSGSMTASRAALIANGTTLAPSQHEADSHSMTSSTSSFTASPFSAALLQAQSLYSQINSIANQDLKSAYLSELNKVSALLAYRDLPVTEQALNEAMDIPAGVKEFLRVERREVLAKRLNVAILEHQGQPGHSVLQHVMKQTKVTWSLLEATRVYFPNQAASSKAAEKGREKEGERVAGLDLTAWIGDTRAPRVTAPPPASPAAS